MNKTNSKLLYAELLTKASESAQKKRTKELQARLAPCKELPQANVSAEASTAGQEEEDYSLLNAFEMLWNVDSAQALRQMQEKQLDFG